MNLRPSQPEEDALFNFGHDGRMEPATDLERTLSRLQRAAGSGQDSAMPPNLKHQILEDIMHAHAAAPAGLTVPDRGTALPRPAARPGHGQHRTGTPRRPWLIALNALMAAALIAALAGAAWRIGWDMPFGGGNDPGRTALPFGGYLAQDEDGSINPADLPTADDCTVEPLTVNEVLWYVTDPFTASNSIDINSPSTPGPDMTPATPPASNASSAVSGPPSRVELDAAAETQRMWMACVLADSYFQKWALEDPFYVQQQVTQALPPLTSVDEARAVLEALRDDGPSDGDRGRVPFISLESLGFPGLGGVHLLDTDPTSAWQDATFMTAGYYSYNEDGTVKHHASIFDNGRGTPVTVDAGYPGGFAPGCTSFILTWNEARAVWFVYAAPNCG